MTEMLSSQQQPLISVREDKCDEVKCVSLSNAFNEQNEIAG